MRLAVVLVLLLGLAAEAQVKLTETAHFVYFKPANALKRSMGLALCFSPVGDAIAAASQLTPFAERYNLLVVGSKEFKNGPNDLAAIKRHLDEEILRPFQPVARRSFCTGLSGGGQVSYSFIHQFPDLFAGVIVNTCRFNPEERAAVERAPASFPRGKFAAMLNSASDFRYAEMQQDKVFLEKLGWRTYWLPFQGGHAYAPRMVMEAALARLSSEGL